MFDINKCYDCFASEPNRTYFWSGLGENGQDIATKVAIENGGITLEMLMDKNKDELISAGFPYDEDLGGFYFSKENAQDWQAISQAYAEQASGDVHAVLGDSVRDCSVWNTKELPALKNNNNVDKVISVDPATGKEKDVLLDKKSSKTVSNICNENRANTIKINSQNVASEIGGGARAPNGEPTNSSSKPTEHGTKLFQEDNSTSNKAFSSERGQKPSLTERESQSKGVERGFKPTESSNNSQINNSTTRGKLPQEEPKNASNASHVQRGKLPDEARDEGFKASTSSSDNYDNKVSTSSNAKATDDASKVAAEQSGQNIVPKNNGMNM